MTTVTPNPRLGVALIRSVAHRTTPSTAEPEIVETIEKVGRGHGGAVRGRPWSLWGILAAVTGLLAGFFSLGQHVAADQPDPYVLMDGLHRTSYHFALVFGLVTFASLLVMVSHLHRWAERLLLFSLILLGGDHRLERPQGTEI